MKKIKLFIFLGLLASCSDNEFKGHDQVFSVYGQQYDIGEAVLWHSNNSTVISQVDSSWVDKYIYQNPLYPWLAPEEREDSVPFFTANIENKQTGNFILSMYEEGILINNVLKSAFGRGACVCLHLYSSDTETLKSGTYRFGTESKEFTFKGFYAADYEFGGEKPVYAIVNGGEVEVAFEGENISVSYDCKTENGASLVGRYTGVYKQLDIRNPEYDKEVVAIANDNLLEALFDTVMSTAPTPIPEPDYVRAKAFFNSMSKDTYTGEEFGNTQVTQNIDKLNRIDIALAYDDAESLIYFESPTKMRKLLWHGEYVNTTSFPMVVYDFDLRCHTKYMSVPVGFSDTDFENIESGEDFDFTMQEERCAFSPEAVCPIFLYMENGHGVRGCIRINRIEPVKDEVVNGVLFHRNPQVYFDLKYRKTQVNQDIF